MRPLGGLDYAGGSTDAVHRTASVLPSTNVGRDGYGHAPLGHHLASHQFVTTPDDAVAGVEDDGSDLLELANYRHSPAGNRVANPR